MKNYFSILCLILFLLACKEGEEIVDYNYQLEVQVQTEVSTFINEHKNYNDSIVFLLDFSLPSNKERFFVYNIQKDSIYHKGLVTHGSCNGKTAKPNSEYSNTVNSYCSSLGKYSIGKDYVGSFGLAYKLHGLEDKNNNAFERFIVLHSHDCVPDVEVNYQICLSQGCPTVSPIYLDTLSEIIDSSDKPILLWIFDNQFNSVSA